VEEFASSCDAPPSPSESAVMMTSEPSHEPATVAVVNMGNGQQRYEVPEDLQRLGYTDCRLFSLSKIALFFKGRLILTDLSKEGWEERFEKSARHIIRARIKGKNNNSSNTLLQHEAIQEGLSFLVLIYIQTHQQDRQQQQQQDLSQWLQQCHNARP
jgi:hypothetical protein